jgi:hypothetical protein
MLVKLTPGIDFTYMFTCSLYEHRFKKCKKTVKSYWSFALLGSAFEKLLVKYW